MRRIGLLAIGLIIGGVLTSPAIAAPICLDGNGDPTTPGGDDGPLVCFDSTPLGGGLTQYDILIDPNSTERSALQTVIAFTGALSQIQGLGTIDATVPGDINLKSEADIADLRGGGYDVNSDSFGRTDIWSTLNPFPDELGNQIHFGFRGGEVGSTLYELSLATPVRDPTPAPLARIVAMGAVGYEGTVGFAGEDFPVMGVIPEPATAGLFAMGLLGLGLRGRRRHGA